MGEVHLVGLEPTFRKYHLTVEVLIRWQKKFKRSTVGSAIHLSEDIHERKKASKTKAQKQAVSEKEDALLRFVASLIVQCLLEKDMPDR